MIVERILRYVLYVVATVACYEVALLARDARLSGVYLEKQIDAIMLPTQKLLGNATGAANGVNTLVGQENKAFASQQAYFDKLTSSTDTTFGNVNGNVIPRLVTVLDTVNSTIRDRSVDLGGVLGNTSTEVEKVQSLTDALTARVNDPVYDKIIANASASMSNLQSMTQSGSETMATVNKGVQYEYEQLTKPPKKLWIIVKGIAGVAGNFFHL